jgi:NTE family protein
MDQPDAGAGERYLPARERQGLALCLSGGGFRASLFHLGALRRLNELGILARITTISSVSGGSIVSAHVAAHWNDLADWDARIASPFRAFTGRNLRTWPILKRLLPWNWLRASTGVEALAAAYEARLTDLRLSGLPAHPRFVFCATDMAFGVSWQSERTSVGDYQAGYTDGRPDWPVGRAVAASSCFPPVFNPLPVRIPPNELVGGKCPPGGVRDSLVRGLRLTDGGVYDNMGLEPVWKNHAVVLVSDGGALFTFEADKNLVWRIQRYTAIQGNQAEAVRKRWLMSNFARGSLSGTYWGVGSVSDHYRLGADGYGEDVVGKFIATIRTDLDAFSEPEASVLENHGYLLTDAAIRTHVADMPVQPAPLKVPHPEWMDESRVAVALKDSHKRKLPFGRG